MIEEGSLAAVLSRAEKALPEAIAKLRAGASNRGQRKAGASKRRQRRVGSTFDLNYRPETYWLDEETGRPYRGTLRDDIPYDLNEEFLPAYEGDEVEIARMSLCSTTGDVISIRARHESDIISFRIVDEYETEFVCSPQQSLQPLAMSELIELIDTTRINGESGGGLVIGLLEEKLYGGYEPDELADFVTLSSDYYPELESYYEKRISDFLAKQAREPEETE
jgi:hypothetical protein